MRLVTKAEFIILKSGFGCSEQRCLVESASGVKGVRGGLRAADQV